MFGPFAGRDFLVALLAMAAVGSAGMAIFRGGERIGRNTAAAAVMIGSAVGGLASLVCSAVGHSPFWIFGVGNRLIDWLLGASTHAAMIMLAGLSAMHSTVSVAAEAADALGDPEDNDDADYADRTHRRRRRRSPRRHHRASRFVTPPQEPVPTELAGLKEE